MVFLIPFLKCLRRFSNRVKGIMHEWSFEENVNSGGGGWGGLAFSCRLRAYLSSDLNKWKLSPYKTPS